MIHSIHLKNFGKHKELGLELHPGVNVLVGKSGQGKSWVIRSINLMAFNKLMISSPTSCTLDEYLYWGAKEASVRMLLDDGLEELTEVIRYRSSKDNYYSLNGQEYRAFGKNPPEDVVKTLNLSAINVQNQFDPLYLLSMSPTEVAKVLNDMVGLDDIDRAMKRIGERLYAERQEEKLQKAAQERAKKDLEEYAGLEALESSIMVVEDLEKRAVDKRRKVSDISRLITRLRLAESKLQDYTGLDDATEKVKGLTDNLSKTKELRDKARSIRSLADRSRKAEQAVKQYSSLDGVLPILTEVEATLQKAAKLREKAKDIRTLANKSRVLGEQVERYDKDLESLEGQFHELMPEECPLCGK